MPGRRRGSFIVVNGNVITSKARPWEASGEMFEKMADEVTKVNRQFLRYVVGEGATILNQNGGRYRLRGSRGNRVPLEGKGDVKAFTTQKNGLVVVGKVRGIPEGFWNIVEFGRGGGYIVYSKQSKTGQLRTSRSGRVRKDFMTKKQVQRVFNRDGALNMLKPVRTPYGPRQYVLIKRGHGPLGNPWARSMRELGELMETDLTTYQTVGLMRVWKGGR